MARVYEHRHSRALAARWIVWEKVGKADRFRGWALRRKVSVSVRPDRNTYIEESLPGAGIGGNTTRHLAPRFLSDTCGDFGVTMVHNPPVLKLTGRGSVPGDTKAGDALGVATNQVVATVVGQPVPRSAPGSSRPGDLPVRSRPPRCA